MFCSKCGTKVDDDANFCYFCGSKINTHIDKSMNSNVKNRIPASEKNKSNSNKELSDKIEATLIVPYGTSNSLTLEDNRKKSPTIIKLVEKDTISKKVIIKDVILKKDIETDVSTHKLSIGFKSVSGLYFKDANDKANEKIKKAIKAYGSSAVNDKIYCCYDDTVFGSADNGFILTDKRICVNNYCDSEYELKYDEIESVSLSEKKISIKKKTGNNYLINISNTESTRNDLLLLLKRFLSTFGN